MDVRRGIGKLNPQQNFYEKLNTVLNLERVRVRVYLGLQMILCVWCSCFSNENCGLSNVKECELPGMVDHLRSKMSP